MAPAPTADPQSHAALELCASVLRKIAEYELEAPLQNRLQDLGERKEFLSPSEHDELMALVEFTRRRTIESLEAKLALRRLKESFPDAVVTH
jgi:hypothetical protein